jgi:tetraacyldisaccharide 4'-kinase
MNWFSRCAIERSLERLWYEKSALAWFFQPFAYIFQALVAVRVRAYERGIFAQESVQVPVIVVGNITVGGAGKTPVVAWLTKRLTEAGRKPGIVSRGYGAQGQSRPVMVTLDSNYQEVGDEPLVLARQTGVPICIDADRVAAARHLVAESGVDIIVADDGLQHYRLRRDFEIAVLDGQRVLGNRRMLPAGPLREPPSRLDEVDLVLVNGESAYSDGIRFDLLPHRAVSLTGTARRHLSEFAGMEVWAVAGIGNPRRFCRMLESFEIKPVLVDLPDHGVVSLPALHRQQSWPILMTEKDAVKYAAPTVENVWYVPVEVQLSERSESMVMKKIRSVLSND